MTTEHMSSGARLWTTRILSGKVTHAQAVQFCHAIYGRAAGYVAGGCRTNVTEQEACTLVDLLAEHPLVVDAVASERGRKWLTANARRLGLPALDWAGIVEFTFSDAYDRGNRYRESFGPIYRARWADGSTFEYAPTAWQAGGDNKCDMYWRHDLAPAPVATMSEV